MLEHRSFVGMDKHSLLSAAPTWRRRRSRKRHGTRDRELLHCNAVKDRTTHSPPRLLPPVRRSLPVQRRPGTDRPPAHLHTPETRKPKRWLWTAPLSPSPTLLELALSFTDDTPNQVPSAQPWYLPQKPPSLYNSVTKQFPAPGRVSYPLNMHRRCALLEVG
jgi:hypothetical protein